MLKSTEREDEPMKMLRISILILLIVSSYSLSDTFAQDWTQMRLPEGAKARLGKGGIGEIAYSPDGNRLAVANNIGIWIYDAHSLIALDLLIGHTDEIISIAFSPNGRTLASSSYDGTVQLWDVNTDTLKSTLIGPTKRVTSIAFSPDGTLLAGGSSDKAVHLWDAVSGEHKAMLAGHTGSITTIAFSPDSKTLASGAWDNTVRLWDIATEKEKVVLSGHTYFGEYTSGISNVAFSADSQVLVSAAFNEEGVYVWDAVTGRQKRTLDAGRISTLAFSPDGKTLAIGGRSALNLWDIVSGEHKAALTKHTSFVNSLAFSPDGKTLVSGGGSQLLLWDAETGVQKGEIDGHQSNGWSIAFSPDGSTLASTGGSGTVHLWDISNRQHKAAFVAERTDDWIGSIAFSPDGKTLAGEGGWRIYLWDIEKTYLKTTLKGYTGSGVSGGGIWSLAFSPDGRFLASGSGHGDMKIQIWYGGRTHKATLTGHTEGITSIDFHPDSRTLASGSQDETVRLWDVIDETYKMTLTGHTDSVNSVAFSPNGKILASGSRDTTICLWDAATGALKTILTGHIDSVESVAFSPDGRTLASGGGYEDNTVQLWDVETRMQQMTLTGHTGRVSSLAFSPDGKTLASGSSDQTILLWDVTPLIETYQIAEDVNRDGTVDLQDLKFIAARFGLLGENDADVNADGVVNIIDLVLVAGELGVGADAPATHPRITELLTAAEVQLWLTAAQRIDNTTLVFQKGIVNLERLLAALSPKETVLLPNYPNPFNPETWIPYQLAVPANVTLRIYAASGALIRTFTLGFQPAGIYQSPSRAVHWDGKNELGEQVASGIYFYTLSTGQSTMTRRMVIRK